MHSKILTHYNSYVSVPLVVRRSNMSKHKIPPDYDTKNHNYTSRNRKHIVQQSVSMQMYIKSSG